jgi:hypothetical protein
MPYPSDLCWPAGPWELLEEFYRVKWLKVYKHLRAIHGIQSMAQYNIDKHLEILKSIDRKASACGWAYPGAVFQVLRSSGTRAMSWHEMRSIDCTDRPCLLTMLEMASIDVRRGWCAIDGVHCLQTSSSSGIALS